MAPIYLHPSLPLPACLDICNAALTAALMATGQFADVRSCWHSLLPSLTLDGWLLMPDRWQATFVASKRLPQHLHCLIAGTGAQCRLSGSHCATKPRRRRYFSDTARARVSTLNLAAQRTMLTTLSVLLNFYFVLNLRLTCLKYTFFTVSKWTSSVHCS